MYDISDMPSDGAEVMLRYLAMMASGLEGGGELRFHISFSYLRREKGQIHTE